MTAEKTPKASWILCPNCGRNDYDAYLAYLEDLASYPLIWRDWNFSEYFWKLDTCPSCNKPLSVIIGTDEKSKIIPIGHIVELFSLEEGKLPITNGPKKSGKTNPVSEDVGQGYRSGAVWDVGLWIAAAVGSGVIGNMAYDAIKRGIITARRRILKRRIQDQKNEGQIQLKTKQLTIKQAYDALLSAKKEAITQGRLLNEGSVALNQDPDLLSACFAIDQLFDKKLKRWKDLSDEELAGLVGHLYERAKLRLEDVRHKNVLPSTTI